MSATNWRQLATSLLSNDTPLDDIVAKVYATYPTTFKSEATCRDAVKRYVKKQGTFEQQVINQRHTMEQQAQHKDLKALTKKKAIADFVVEGCTEALSTRERRPITPLIIPATAAPDHIAILEFSDVQAGTLITKESTGGLNEFNWDILTTYFSNLYVGISEVLHSLQASLNIRELHIHMLGDIVEGSQIFPGQEQHICRDLFHQAIGVVDLIEDLLIKCLSLVDTIKIVAVCGNHGRVGKKGENPHWVNWDRIVYEFIRREMVAYNDRITWQMDDSWWQIDTVWQWKFYLTHGDDIRCWAGIPYYGVDRSAQRETELLRLSHEWYDYFMIGHLHTPSIIPGVATTKFINGCFPGGTIFSMKNMGVATQPQQWLLLVHPQWGVTYNCPIYLRR